MKRRNNRKITILVILILIVMMGLINKGEKEREVTLSSLNTNMVAIKIENEETGEYENVSKVPTSGYKLNTDSSYCEVNRVVDETITMSYSNGKVKVQIEDKGTKCYAYFDIIKETAKEYILSLTTVNETTPDFSTTATTDEGMFMAEDDDGTSYYYRGAVDDNYFYFAGYYWRIVRINGDGTIRLIYQGTTPTATGTDAQIGTSAFNSTSSDNMYVGYMYTSGSVHGLGTSSTIKGVIDDWYDDNLANYTEYIDSDAGFCGDRTSYTNTSGTTSGGGTGTTTTYYGAYVRLKANKSPSLKCSDSNNLYTLTSSSKGNKALSKPIGLITADEVNMNISSQYLML